MQRTRRGLTLALLGVLMLVLLSSDATAQIDPAEAAPRGAQKREASLSPTEFPHFPENPLPDQLLQPAQSVQRESLRPNPDSDNEREPRQDPNVEYEGDRAPDALRAVVLVDEDADSAPKAAHNQEDKDNEKDNEKDSDKKDTDDDVDDNVGDDAPALAGNARVVVESEAESLLQASEPGMDASEPHMDRVGHIELFEDMLRGQNRDREDGQWPGHFPDGAPFTRSESESESESAATSVSVSASAPNPASGGGSRSDGYNPSLSTSHSQLLSAPNSVSNVASLSLSGLYPASLSGSLSASESESKSSIPSPLPSEAISASLLDSESDSLLPTELSSKSYTASPDHAPSSNSMSQSQSQSKLIPHTQTQSQSQTQTHPDSQSYSHSQSRPNSMVADTATSSPSREFSAPTESHYLPETSPCSILATQSSVEAESQSQTESMSETGSAFSSISVFTDKQTLIPEPASSGEATFETASASAGHPTSAASITDSNTFSDYSLKESELISSLSESPSLNFTFTEVQSDLVSSVPTEIMPSPVNSNTLESPSTSESETMASPGSQRPTKKRRSHSVSPRATYSANSESTKPQNTDLETQTNIHSLTTKVNSNTGPSETEGNNFPGNSQSTTGSFSTREVAASATSKFGKTISKSPAKTKLTQSPLSLSDSLSQSETSSESTYGSFVHPESNPNSNPESDFNVDSETHSQSESHVSVAHSNTNTPNVKDSHRPSKSTFNFHESPSLKINSASPTPKMHRSKSTQQSHSLVSSSDTTASKNKAKITHSGQINHSSKLSKPSSSATQSTSTKYYTMSKGITISSSYFTSNYQRGSNTQSHRQKPTYTSLGGVPTKTMSGNASTRNSFTQDKSRKQTQTTAQILQESETKAKSRTHSYSYSQPQSRSQSHSNSQSQSQSELPLVTRSKSRTPQLDCPTGTYPNECRQCGPKKPSIPIEFSVNPEDAGFTLGKPLMSQSSSWSSSQNFTGIRYNSNTQVIATVANLNAKVAVSHSNTVPVLPKGFTVTTSIYKGMSTIYVRAWLVGSNGETITSGGFLEVYLKESTSTRASCNNDGINPCLLALQPSDSVFSTAQDITFTPVVTYNTQSLELETLVAKKLPTYSPNPAKGMMMNIPIPPVIPGNTFQTPITAFTGESILQGFTVLVSFDPSVLQVISIDGGNKYAVTPNLSDQPISIVCLKLDAFDNNLAKGTISNAITITWRFISSPQSNQAQISFSISEMTDIQSYPIIDPKTSGIVQDGKGSGTVGTVYIAVDSIRGYFVSSQKPEIFNIAILNKQAITLPISVYQYWEFKEKIDLSSSAQCTLNSNDIASVSGCTVVMNGSEQNGGYLTVTSNSVQTTIRAWIPETPVQLLVEDTTLLAINGTMDSSCKKQLYQKTQTRTQAKFSSDADTFLADVSPFVTLVSSNGDVAYINGQEVQGTAPGTSTITINGVPSNSITVTVSDDKAYVKHLEVSVVTDLTSSVNNPGPYKTSDLNTVTAVATQNFATENKAGGVVAYALFTDGKKMILTESMGLVVSAANPSILVTSNPISVIAKDAGCGYYVIADWNACGTTIASGKGLVNLKLPKITSISARTQESPRITKSSDLSALAGVSTYLTLSVSVRFETGQTMDYTLDPRTVYTVSADSKSIIDVVETQQNGKRSSVGIKVTGNSIGQATVLVSISTAPQVTPVSVVVNVVLFSKLNVDANPYPTFSGSSSLSKNLLNKIECTSVYQQATLRLYMTLSNNDVLDVTSNQYASFSLHEGKGGDIATVAGRLVTPSGSSFGQVNVDGTFSTATSDSFVITVSDSFVRVSSLSTYFPGTFRGIKDKATQKMGVSAAFDDGTQFTDATGLTGLLSYASSNTAIISIDRTTGMATLRDNYLVAATLTASTCKGIYASSSVYANLDADIGDIDLGNSDGTQFSIVQSNSQFVMNVFVNTGSQILGSMDIVVTYDGGYLTAVSAQQGSNWPGGQIDITLNDPIGKVKIVGVTTPGTSASGSRINIAQITFSATNNGPSIVSGYVNKLLGSDVSATPIGPTLGVGQTRTFVAGTGYIQIGNQRIIYLKPIERKPSASVVSIVAREQNQCNPATIRGNANNDCEFSVADVQFTVQVIANLIKTPMTNSQLRWLDANEDGKVGIPDAIFLLRVLSGKWRFIDTSMSFMPGYACVPTFKVSPKDMSGATLTSRTSFAFEVLTSNNKDMEMLMGTMQTTSVGVRVAPTLSGSDFISRFRTKHAESSIGIAFTMTTQDANGNSGLDREVTMYKGLNDVILPYMSFNPGNVSLMGVPKLVSATFEPYGQNISVVFDMPTDRAGLFDTFDCDILFAGLDGLSCRWNDDTTALIQASCSTKLTIGTNIALVEGKLRIKSPCPGSPSSTGSVSVSMPSTLVSIVVGLSGPQRIGKCSQLDLDSSATKFISSRCSNVSYKWTLSSKTPITESFMPNITKILEKSTDTLSIDDDLPPGNFYTFTLTVSTPFGVSGNGSIIVEKATEALPTIMVGGTRAQSALPSRFTTLSGSGKIPKCLTGTSIDFTWDQTSGDSITLNPILKSTNTMTLTPFLIMPFKSYGLRLTGCVPLGGNEKACNYADVTINGISSGLRAMIAGGTASVAGTVRDFTVDATISLDPEVQIQDLAAMRYSWTCRNLTSLQPCQNPGNSQEITFAKDGILTIKQSKTSVTLDPGFYLFTATVTKITGAYTPASASKTIQIVDGDPPIVSVSPLDQEFPSVSLPLRMSGTAISTMNNPLTYSWVISGGVSSFSELGMDPSSLTSPRLSIPANRLKDNTEFTVRFVARDPVQKISGYSEMTFKTNVLPFGGTFEIPSNGEEQMSPFTFQAKGWQTFDFNYPLSFAFGYILTDGGLDQVVSSYAPSSTRSIIMPAGKMSGAKAEMTLMKGVLYITDVNSNTLRLEKFVDVKPLVFADDAARAASSDAFVSSQMNAALLQGNLDLVGQYNSGSMDIINSMASGSARMSAERKQTSAKCSTAQTTASGTRSKAFNVMKTTNSKQVFYTALQSDGNIQQFSSILGDTCLSSTLISDGSTYLSQLAGKTSTTSVLKTTGSSVLSAYANLFASSQKLPSSRRAGTTAPETILETAENATKTIARSGIKDQLCGDTGYSASSTLMQTSSYKQCSDSNPTTVTVSTTGSPSVLLSKEAYGTSTNPTLHVSNTANNFYQSTATMGSTILNVDLETSGVNGQEISVQNLQAPITITLARANPDNVDLTQYTPTCSYYDEAKKDWSDGGCTLVSYTNTQVVCKCTHLTSFASNLRQIVGATKSRSRGRSRSRSKKPVRASNSRGPGLQTPSKRPGGGGGGGGGGSVGAIIGGVLGGIGAALTIGGVVIYIRRRSLMRSAPAKPPPRRNTPPATEPGYVPTYPQSPRSPVSPSGSSGSSSTSTSLRSGRGPQPTLPYDAEERVY